MLNTQDFTHLQEIYRSEKTSVWTAIDKQTNKKVAIKLLNEEFPSTNQIARFNGEAEISQRFAEEGVRKIIGKYKIDNKYALVMEYIDGTSLQDFRRNSPIEIATFLDIAINIARVVGKIHRQGIVHKDINPRNILVKPTSDICIIDFGIASPFKREVQKFETPERLEGTLAYISPEQTGRMNHSVDSRSDLYSLGVTFYEMLANTLPFESESPIELVHSQIAKLPPSLQGKVPSLPPILEKIIMKLLEKSVEERYQTAEGLCYDLIVCREHIKQLAHLDFELGKDDHNENFQIPEKLYGREKERDGLLEAFYNAEAGGSGCVLVGGHSGIGKTSLVRELYKPVTAKRSYFITGKFEQFQRDTPYSAIIQAINGLIQQFLGESDKRLTHWRNEILEALESNAGVLTELVPNLEKIIGKQDTPPVLPPLESQNRFNRVFQQFFEKLSTAKHTFVIFIDDWQWADQPSLDFLRLLMAGATSKYLLFIMAYRSNEVTPAHPFRLTLDALKEAQTPITTFELQDLETIHIQQLLQDTLNATHEETTDLAELIKKKTSGNAFFVTQFLQNLYEQKYIVYQIENKKWHWDIKKIQELPISDNVLDLMTVRLKNLPTETLEILKLAACIGNQFSLHLLSDLAGKLSVEVYEILFPALEQGFIQPHYGNAYAIDESHQGTSNSFKFLHDKVEQSVYLLASEQQQKEVCLEVGRLTYQNGNEAYKQQWICEIANYYNKGKSLIQADTERMTLAEINLRANIKAKKVSAYSSAVVYAREGIMALGENAWQKHFDNCFELHKNMADSLFLSGEKEEAENIFEMVLQKAQSRLQKIQIYNMKNLLYESSARYQETIVNAREALKLLSIVLPEKEEEKQQLFQKEAEFINQTLEQQGGVAFFRNLPEMQQEEIKEAVQILQTAWSSCYMAGDMNLVLLTAAQIIGIAIKHGNTPETAWAYVAHATFVSMGLGQYKLGYDLAMLSIELNDKYHDLKAKGPIHHLMGIFIHHWRKPVRTGLHYFKTAFEASLASGNYGYAGYAHCVSTRHELLAGLPLAEIALQADQYRQMQHSIKNYTIALLGTVVNAFVKNLMGKSKSKTSFDNEEFDERDYLETYQALPIFRAIYEPLKARMYYYQNDFENALLHTERAKPMMIALFGSEWNWFQNVNYSLILCGIVREMHVSEEIKAQYMAQIQQNQAQMKIWVENCPENFSHHYWLIEAEIAQIEDDYVQAMRHYDKAIKWAQVQEFMQDEALAQELAGKFYLAQNQEDFAKIYLQRAYHTYKIWGAVTKTEQMREAYKQLLSGRKEMRFKSATTIENTKVSTSTLYGDNSLDFLSIIKASQAISQEIKLENLLQTMVTILMENAGAERAIILQDREKQLYIAAEAVSGRQDITIMRPIPLNEQDRSYLSLSIILHTYRTNEIVIIHDAKKDKQFIMDAHIQHGKVKSILCLPIVQQNHIKAVIYLEHSQIAGAFTKERLDILNMLSSQIAISLENSLLYNTMEQKVALRTQELQEQKELVEYKNNNIIASITYAQRIQQAILPLPEYMNELIPENFVLFKPKDIVSGDFYYLHEKDKKIILAVIDCTGHGVPGAFMSMLGSETLNEIIQNKNITEPDIILNMLHQNIRKSLKQKETDNRDGMDLALLVWNKEKREVVFAGAKSPVIYIQTDELYSIRGNVFPIGGEQKEANRTFSKHVIPLKDSPTAFYLFSDGYQDQFGGDSNKKFGLGQLKKILLEIHQLPMSEQKDILLKSFEKWKQKSNESQIDDVLVLGCRI